MKNLSALRGFVFAASFMLAVRLVSVAHAADGSAAFGNFGCLAIAGDLGSVDESRDLAPLTREPSLGDGQGFNFYVEFKGYHFSASLLPQSEERAMVWGTIVAPDGKALQSASIVMRDTAFQLIYGSEAALACAPPES